MKFVSLNSNGVDKQVIERLTEYTCELDKFTYKTADGEYGVLSGFAVGYCVVSDDIDPSAITVEFVADFLKPYKIAELTAACDLRIDRGFTYTNGDKFAYDVSTQNEFTQKQMSFFFYPNLTTAQVKTLNNGIKYYPKNDFMDLVLFANNFKDETQKRLSDLVDEINATKYQDITQLKYITFS